MGGRPRKKSIGGERETLEEERVMKFVWQENRRESLWEEGGNHQEKGRRHREGSQRRKEKGQKYKDLCVKIP